jgi:formate C-acetyltransferase
MKVEAWSGFVPGKWQSAIDVHDFIKLNYKPYCGGREFLQGATGRTQKIMEKLGELLKAERQAGGVLDIDTSTVSSLLNYKPGYLDRENEIIVGLQTDSPLKRGVNPFGGIRLARAACEAYGHKLSEKIEDEFNYRTTHNDGVYRVYSEEMKKALHPTKGENAE